LSEDPLGVEGGLNVYSYAANDPVNRRDPLGLCPGGAEPIGWKTVATDDGIEWVPICEGGGLQSYGLEPVEVTPGLGIRHAARVRLELGLEQPWRLAAAFGS